MACDDQSTIRVGIDLASVDDVAASVARFGRRYTERIYTPRELSDCAGSPRAQARSLAARFAAKEAVIKVLRPAVDVPSWTEIEVRRAQSGACDLRLSGLAASLADDLGLNQWSVSLTHESELAAAVVIATGSPLGTDRAPQPNPRIYEKD